MKFPDIVSTIFLALAITFVSAFFLSKCINPRCLEINLQACVNSCYYTPSITVFKELNLLGKAAIFLDRPFSFTFGAVAWSIVLFALRVIINWLLSIKPEGR